MKFSILITSFNKGEYIEECIKSCLNQTYSNFEIIVCDNYSKDGSKKIFKKYKDKIKLFQKKRISNFSAINQIDLIKLGFLKSKGNFICLLDADDYFYPKKLEILKKKHLNKKKLDVIFDLSVKKKFNVYTKLTLKKKVQKFIWPTIINTSSISIKKSFLKRCIKNRLLEKFNLLEVDFRINVFSRCIKKNFLIINDDITVYRILQNSAMSSLKKFSARWWCKRYEAHMFMKELYKNNNLVYSNKVDFFMSKTLARILI
jgi:glycosyltransferase involved in cell wall biosynthesis